MHLGEFFVTLQDQTLVENPKHQRARGRLVLGVKSDDGRTRLKDVRQEGSFRMLFPRQSDKGIEAVSLNTAGGITGGDRFTIDATAEAGSKLTLTTQAAERVYRAVGTQVGRFTTRLTVADGATLHWLPQETILFDGCALDRTLHVDLAPDAEFLMIEPLVFGRITSGETVQNGLLKDKIMVRRNGTPIYNDSVHLNGMIDAKLHRPALGAAMRSMASIVLCCKDAARHLDALRDILPDSAGASALNDDTLVMRVLAQDSFVMRQTVVPALALLTKSTLPKTWRL